MDTITKNNGFNTGIAAEYFILSQLYRRDIEAYISQGNKKAIDIRPDDLCSALAVYNRGLEQGRCEEGRSEYYYAMVVMDTYDKICSATDLCKRC